MSSYVQIAMTQGEKLIYEGKVSFWSLLPLVILGLLLLGVAGIGILFWIGAFIRYKTTELAITNKRVIAKFGFISRSTVELNIDKAESIQVRQGILGRIFDYGSIIVSGAGSTQTPIPGISRPMKFRQTFLATQENFRKSYHNGITS